MPFGIEKLMAWLPEDEKKLKICLFVLTKCTNVTDTQTDRHRMTAKARLHSIARQKMGNTIDRCKYVFMFLKFF